VLIAGGELAGGQAADNPGTDDGGYSSRHRYAP
jgi:hypothetical protein